VLSRRFTSAFEAAERLRSPMLKRSADDTGPVTVRHDRLGADDQREFQAVEQDLAVMPAVHAVDHLGGAMLVRRRRLRGLVRVQVTCPRVFGPSNAVFRA
jgi:hypothetical protein